MSCEHVTHEIFPSLGSSRSFGWFHCDIVNDRPRLSLAVSRLCNVNDSRVARRRQILPCDQSHGFLLYEVENLVEFRNDWRGEYL